MLKQIVERYARLQGGLKPSQMDRFKNWIEFRDTDGNFSQRRRIDSTLLELHHFLAGQFLLDAFDHCVKMLLLVDIIQVIGSDG